MKASYVGHSFSLSHILAICLCLLSQELLIELLPRLVSCKTQQICGRQRQDSSWQCEQCIPMSWMGKSGRRPSQAPQSAPAWVWRGFERQGTPRCLHFQRAGFGFLKDPCGAQWLKSHSIWGHYLAYLFRHESLPSRNPLSTREINNWRVTMTRHGGIFCRRRLD